MNITLIFIRTNNHSSGPQFQRQVLFPYFRKKGPFSPPPTLDTTTDVPWKKEAKKSFLLSTSISPRKWRGKREKGERKREASSPSLNVRQSLVLKGGGKRGRRRNLEFLRNEVPPPPPPCTSVLLKFWEEIPFLDGWTGITNYLIDISAQLQGFNTS